jgi:hypothetical protein
MHRNKTCNMEDLILPNNRSMKEQARRVAADLKRRVAYTVTRANLSKVSKVSDVTELSNVMDLNEALNSMAPTMPTFGPASPKPMTVQGSLYRSA